MTDRYTDLDLMLKVLNHNTWSNNTLLDLDSLGAGGSKEHLILFNTQIKLTDLNTKSELFRAISGISEYSYHNGDQRKTPIKIFNDEYQRLVNGGKINKSFFYDLRGKFKEYLTPVKGSDIEEDRS